MFQVISRDDSECVIDFKGYQSNCHGLFRLYSISRSFEGSRRFTGAFKSISVAF